MMSRSCLVSDGYFIFRLQRRVWNFMSAKHLRFSDDIVFFRSCYLAALRQGCADVACDVFDAPIRGCLSRRDGANQSVWNP